MVPHTVPPVSAGYAMPCAMDFFLANTKPTREPMATAPTWNTRLVSFTPIDSSAPTLHVVIAFVRWFYLTLYFTICDLHRFVHRISKLVLFNL